MASTGYAQDVQEKFNTLQPVDRAPLIAQMQQLRQMIWEAHLHLNRLAGSEPSHSEGESGPADVSSAPLSLRIEAMQAIVNMCQHEVGELIRRIDRVTEESAALA